MYDDDYGTNKGKRNSVFLIIAVIAITLIVIIMADYRKQAVTSQSNKQPVDIKAAILETHEYDIHANEDENFIRLVYSETGDWSNSLNLAVASVVRNRINSPDFPNTINEVIFQNSQFQSVYTGSIADYPSIPDSNIQNIQRCIDASKNYDETDGALFYYRISDKSAEENQWILENFEHTIIDGYCFLKVFPYQ